VLLADPGRGVVGAVHAGRAGVLLGVVGRAVERMRAEGAERLVAWVGPHVCGECYEVPEQMRAEVASRVPQTSAVTRWGTPSLDVGAGVRAQLDDLGIEVTEVGRCTLEDTGLHSHRRDGAAAGRMAGLVWMS
jgi:copper oxidase (laccase) domain-containing protein